jgi:amino acid adenylation domain-containing protein
VCKKWSKLVNVFIEFTPPFKGKDMKKFLSNLSQRIATLSPEKRALLEQKLMQQSAAGMNTHAIPRRKTSSPCPLSFAQQRLWFLDQLEPHSPLYNLPKAIRLQGALDLTALQQTLNAIVARHEVLRTTFTTMAGTPVQVIGDSQPVELSVVDLRQVPEADREAEMYCQLRQAAQRPFDLSRDIMLRATLLQLGAGEHVLLLTTHHIASDGWSSGVLSHEFAAFYRAYVTGESVSLPVLPIQYADYAVWQQQWLQGEALESQLAYWKQQLKGSPPVLELPTDRPRPTVQTYRGAIQGFVFPALLTEALKALSRQAGVTLYMTLLAALQTLLHRYTGQHDIVVGSPIAGRTRVETEALIGFFVNNLVLRTKLSGNPPFHELLHRVREVAMGAYAHQELPFEKLVEELQPERSLSYAPLFQVMFAFQNAPRPPLALPGLTLSQLNIDCGTAKFDLTLSMWEEAGSLTGTVEYSTDLFDSSTVTRMFRYLQTVLEGVVAHPEQRLADLPLLPAAERQQILVDWNATATPPPQAVGLHHLFEAQVERTPDSIAVIADNGQLTYRQLNQCANQLAHHLQALGVQPDVLVGLCMERSLDMVIGLLGILKAGGAYVPLDPAYPSERLAFMLHDAHVAGLVTQPQLVEKLPAPQTPVVCLAPGQEALAHARPDNPVSGVTAEQLAYVIYTSGSTGTPKGVQIPHCAVVNFLESMRHQPGLTANDRLLAVTTLSFDIAGLELFLPLSVGARVVVVDRAVAADGKRLGQRLAETGATVMQATPATWRLLLEAGWQGSPGLKILCGGEALPWELAQQLLSRGASLWSLYGPTETTVWSAVMPVSAAHGWVSLGWPIANTQLYVLDRQLGPVPIGVPGELYIGGTGVARGYLNRPELTAERFLPDPFRQVPGARLYKTGDRVRYRPDGTLEFLGRLDHQMKIRGFRIELGEIEAILHQHPAVQAAIVIAREDTPGDQRLVAYLVANHQPLPAPGILRRFVQEKLPDYMVPSAFVGLQTLPLTPNGKVNRRALPAPEQQRPEPERLVQTSGDALEQLLTKVWEDVLGVRPIGIRDDFFALGGHSLLAVRLFAQIESILGHELPLATLFQAPTVEQLASVLREEGCTIPQSLTN